MEHLQRIQATGVEVLALENIPDLPPDLMPYWEGYCNLDASRQWGYGAPQPVATSDILAEATLQSFRGAALQAFVYFVRQMDRLYLKRQSDKRAIAGS